MQGTCALNAEHIIKLLTFDAIDKNKAAGSGVTEISARLADLVKVCSVLHLQRGLHVCMQPVTAVAAFPIATHARGRLSTGTP